MDKNIEIKKAMLFGSMLGDGWISTTKNCGFSGDVKSLENIKNDLKEIFGDIGKGTIYTSKTHSKKYNIEGITNKLYVNRKVTKSFESMGMPIGKRVENHYLLPDWIINGSLDVKKSFLSGFYSAEWYTPSMQKNDKTLKPLGITITKREYLKESMDLLILQFEKILLELNIEYNIKTKYAFTCEKNIRIDIVFKNNNKNISNLLNILDLRYCVNKQKEIYFLRLYYDKKLKLLNNLQIAYDIAISSNCSVKDIAKKYEISEYQIRHWKKRKTGIRIPLSFVKYSEFKKQISSL